MHAHVQMFVHVRAAPHVRTDVRAPTHLDAEDARRYTNARTWVLANACT